MSVVKTYPEELTAQGLVEQRKARMVAIMDEPVKLDMVGAPDDPIADEAWLDLERLVNHWAAIVKLQAIGREFSGP